jgi:predicted ABC-type ATPase
MKKIFIIAGPNGAGKTTFASEFLPQEAGCLEFVNADLIAAGLSPFQPEKVAVSAGRLMLKRISDLVDARKSFAFETTLATKTYARSIPAWREFGYQVKLVFLKLPSSDFAIQRVEQRVRLGGHFIPPDSIRRRFARGWENLQSLYLGLVDEWSIYDASKAPAMLMEKGDNRQPPPTLMEDPATYRIADPQMVPIEPLDDPDFIGAEAAFKRAAAKAIAQARAAGLEPIVSNPADLPKKN